MSEPRNRSALERLPKELKSAIFTALPDIESLQSAILTARELYLSFKTDEESIVRQVLSRQIQRGLLDDAVAVWDAERAEHKGWNLEQISRLFSTYHSRTETFLRYCDLSKACQLVRFHRIVQSLSKQLAEQALLCASEENPQYIVNDIAGEQELVRTQRAFYRFELYCLFFGVEKQRLIQPDLGQREAFWDHFAPWEIEQVASVYEHSRSQQSKVFEELALQVPDWTEFASITGILGDARDEFLQAQVTLGLQRAQLVQEIGKDTMRNHVLLLPPPRRKEQCFDFRSIQESLDHAVDPGELLMLHEIEQDPIKARKVIKSPFVVEVDIGPENAWRWAHRNVYPDYAERSGFVLSDAQTPLRQWGYVFWKRNRLDAWRLFEMPWLAADATLNSRRSGGEIAHYVQKLRETTEEMIRTRVLHRGPALWCD